MCYSWKIPHQSTKKKKRGGVIVIFIGETKHCLWLLLLKALLFGDGMRKPTFPERESNVVRAVHLLSAPGPSCRDISSYRFPEEAAPCTPSVMTPGTVTVRGWNRKRFVAANGFQMWAPCGHRARLGVLEQVATPSLERGGSGGWDRIRQPDL